MEKTKIDWCDSTWNPVTGCYHSCEYCYARSIAERFTVFHAKDYNGALSVLDEPYKGSDGKVQAYPYAFMPTFHRYRLGEYEKKKGRNIFLCSMADLFGDWVPDSWIKEVFKACMKAPQHNYLFLTKNPKRYVALMQAGLLPKEDNMWYGTSATDRDSFFDVSKIMGKLDEKYKTFASIEPLLGDIWKESWESGVWGFYDWIIIGAESGRRKDRVIPEKDWIDRIAKACKEKSVPVYMKSSLDDIMGKEGLKEFPIGLRKNNIFRLN